MTTRRLCQLVLIVAASLLAVSGSRGQPAYKLGVKPELKPEAVLKLEDNKISRTAVKDDPGFRLQYHFKKDGKTVTTLEARADEWIACPVKEPGTYTVVLEIFFPTFKTGNVQKGEFKPISNVLTLKVDGDKVTAVETAEKK